MAPSQNPMQQFLDTDDDFRPVIVTISHEDKPDPEGSVLVGFRVLRWGSFFQILPQACWMETSGRAIDCQMIREDEMDGAHLTVLMAIADQLTDEIDPASIYVWN